MLQSLTVSLGHRRSNVVFFPCLQKLFFWVVSFPLGSWRSAHLIIFRFESLHPNLVRPCTERQRGMKKWFCSNKKVLGVSADDIFIDVMLCIK